MKTTLITMGFEGDIIENVGIARIKAYLDSKDYENDVVYFNKDEDLNTVISRIDGNSKLFGFSIYDNSIMDSIQIAKALKANNKDCITFVGSKYATCYYREILQDDRFQAFDYVVLGDGEYTISEMIEEVQSNEDNISFLSDYIASRNHLDAVKPRVIEINDLPLPDRTMIRERGYFHAYICDCHGCCEHCSFCTQGLYYKKWNGRSAENIYHEIKHLNKTDNILCFNFTGGSFEDPGTMGKEKIRSLCKLILDDGLNISLKCYLRSNSFKDNTEDVQLLNLMKQAGFNLVFVGIESGNNTDLKIYNKNTTVAQNRQMLRLLSEADIYAGSFGFIMLNPYSTQESMKENYRFLVEVASCDMYSYISRLRADSGTRIRKMILDDGLMQSDDFMLQGYSYQFQHKEAAAVNAFIKDHFFDSNITKIVSNTDTIPSFIHELYRFLTNGEEYIASLNELLNHYRSLFQQYFKNLYDGFNPEVCEREFPAFCDELKTLDDRLVIMKRLFMIELIKQKVIQRKIWDRKTEALYESL